MNSIYRTIILLAAILISSTVIGQESNFDPNELKIEYFQDKEIKHDLEFSDKKGNSFKIINSDYAKGLKINKDGKWQKHGVYFTMYEGRVTQKTDYQFGLKHGSEESYYKSGKVNFIKSYKKGLKDGKRYQYREDGSLTEKREYQSDLEQGTRISYHKNGTKDYVVPIINGERHGTAISHNDEGKVTSESQWNMGNKVGKTKWFD